jgi:uncharacterized RDD family membrane protein YckC
MQDKSKSRAGFGPRLAAYAVDKLLVGLALLLVRIPAWVVSFGQGSASPVLFDYTAADIVCYVLSAAYFVLLTYFTGGTLGKKVMGLHVEKSDGTALGFVDVLYRETVGRFLSGIACLGYIMILADRDKRGFHDWLCATCVCYNDKITDPPVKKDVPWTNPTDYPIPGREETAGE